MAVRANSPKRPSSVLAIRAHRAIHIHFIFVARIGTCHDRDRDGRQSAVASPRAAQKSCCRGSRRYCFGSTPSSPLFPFYNNPTPPDPEPSVTSLRSSPPRSKTPRAEVMAKALRPKRRSRHKRTKTNPPPTPTSPHYPAAWSRGRRFFPIRACTAALSCLRRWPMWHRAGVIRSWATRSSSCSRP